MVFYGDTAEARSKSREDSLPAFPKQLGTRSITGSYTRQHFNVYKTEDGKFIRPSVEADTDRQQGKLQNRETLPAPYRRAEPSDWGFMETAARNAPSNLWTAEQ